MSLVKRFKDYSEKGFLKIFTFIRAKLILAFLVPVSFIIILGMLSFFKSREGLVESYENNTLSNITNLSKYLDFGFNITSSKAVFLANDEVLKSYYAGYYKEDNMKQISRLREINETLMSSIISSDYISNIYVLSGNGESIACKGTVSNKLDYDDFIKNGEGALLEKNNIKDMWMGTHPYLDKLSFTKKDAYAVSYIKYIYGAANKKLGCVLIDVSYDFVNSILAGSGMPDGSAIAFISKDGREIVNGKLPENFKFAEQKYYSKAVNGEDNAAYEYITLNKNNYLFVFSKIQTSDSLLCAVIPNSIIVKQASKVKNITLTIVIIASVLAIILGAFMASGFSTAIHKIIKVLKKTESGDLTYQASIKRRDEFSILGRSINEMIGSMMKLIKKMSGISTTVSQSACSVSESSAVLVDATQNITQAVGDIEQGITQQAAESGKCLQQMGDLAERINAVYDNTHSIEQIAGNTRNIVNDGMEIVDNLGKKANNTAVITKDVIMDIESLAKESGAVRKIIETINEIAEQTNLLSLNASIEAARAGEAGRGFAVVADEIRKLADQSVKSSGEIEAIIRRIEEQTTKTVTTAKYAESIVSSQQDALNGTINAFADINSHVEKLTENLNRIVKDIEGIENAKNDTLGAIESISATSEETAAAAEQLGVTAQKQMDQVNKLNDVVKQLGNDAVNMEESVSVFKVD